MKRMIVPIILIFSVLILVNDASAQDRRGCEPGRASSSTGSWEDEREKILAEGYFKQGLRLYSAGQYDLAMEEFMEAYSIDQTNEEAADYIAKTEDAIARQERKAEIKGLDREHKKVDRLIRESSEDTRDFRPEDAVIKMGRAKIIDPDNRRVDRLYRDARASEISKTMFRLQDEIDVENESRLIDVNRAWLEPTISTQKDLYYYGTKRAREEESRIDEMADITIPLIEFNDAQLRDVLKYLSQQSQINIAIDEIAVMPEEKITVYLKDTTLLDALKIILRSKGLTYRLEENLIWVTTKERLKNEDMVVKVYDVQDILGKVHDFPAQSLDKDMVTKKEDKDKKNK